MFLLNKKTFQALAAPYRTEGLPSAMQMAVLQRHHQP